MSDQPKKFRVLLKPLGDEYGQRELSHNQHRLDIIKRMERAGVMDHPFGNSKDIENKIEILKSKIKSDTQGAAPRVIDADFIKVIDNASMLIGIEPGLRTTTSRAITSKRGAHAKALRVRKENPEFYQLSYTPNGVRDANDPSSSKYIITRKFKKILSVNIDNVISVNGKQMMGAMRDLDKGVQQLGLEEGWSIDSISDLLDE